jgi:hypothetical protein
MALATIPTIQLADDSLMRMQQNMVNGINTLNQKEITDGSLLTGVSLQLATTNRIAHKLGRTIKGYFLSNQSTGALIWRGDMSEPETYLKLFSSANTVVDIWVF